MAPKELDTAGVEDVGLVLDELDTTGVEDVGLVLDELLCSSHEGGLLEGFPVAAAASSKTATLVLQHLVFSPSDSQQYLAGEP